MKELLNAMREELEKRETKLKKDLQDRDKKRAEWLGKALSVLWNEAGEQVSEEIKQWDDALREELKEMIEKFKREMSNRDKNFKLELIEREKAWMSNWKHCKHSLKITFSKACNTNIMLTSIGKRQKTKGACGGK